MLGQFVSSGRHAAAKELSDSCHSVRDGVLCRHFLAVQGTHNISKAVPEFDFHCPMAFAALQKSCESKGINIPLSIECYSSIFPFALTSAAELMYSWTDLLLASHLSLFVTSFCVVFKLLNVIKFSFVCVSNGNVETKRPSRRTYSNRLR